MNGTPVTVSASATLVVPQGVGEVNNPQSVLLKVPTGGTTVYVGSAAVTGASAEEGFPIAAGEVASIDTVGEPLYAIVTTGTQKLYRLRSRV